MNRYIVCLTYQVWVEAENPESAELKVLERLKNVKRAKGVVETPAAVTVIDTADVRRADR